jgi:1-acyl-sn-glycerol-3-phosphate acyltransferase
MKRTATAALRMIFVVPLFLIFTFANAAFIIVYGTFRPASPIHDQIVKRWSYFFLRIPPVRFTIEGSHNVDPKQRYVVVSNHLSMFDIPMLFYALPLHGRFLSKKEVFKIPLVGRAMRTIGIIEIDRSSGQSSRQAINEGVKIAAERGYSLIVFPEGTRSRDGNLLPFKKGAFRIAIDSGLPILPVVIEGTDRVSKPGSKLFHPGEASVTILEPIATADMTNKVDLTSLMRTVEASMTTVYEEKHGTNSV